MPVNNTDDFRHLYERIEEALTMVDQGIVDETADDNIRYIVNWISIWPGSDRATNAKAIKHTAEELYDVWDECLVL